MSGSIQQQSSESPSDQSEAERILANIRSLRNDIVIAWRERGVLLTSEERRELRSEINQTCKFLEDLTRSA